MESDRNIRTLAFGCTDEKSHTQPGTLHPIGLCRCRIANGYMGRGVSD